jgi:hypothetical protein
VREALRPYRHMYVSRSGPLPCGSKTLYFLIPFTNVCF